ncbi:MAG: Na+/H+ antiporter NhaA [Flavobacteriales bacterium]|jgi:NhaA family Na+:H+ antiporter|nr:Na+/H+ antiporter NhaA [Flavobacteriales bacterium]
MRQDPIDHLLKPLDRFIRNQSVAGLALFISAAVALVLANSPWREAYHEFWEHSITLGIDTFIFERNLHHLINDGLMAIFFFVVALELKREFLAGELSDPRNAVLPLAASVGGMVFPALLYLAINNFEGPATRGWGITMGTDTAFVLGLLALLGKRVPPAIKALFITVAVTDDIASVTVIALFYTSDISMMNLGIGAAFMVVLVAMNLLGVRNITAYGVIGIGGLWTAFMLSGVHATVAGVLAALTIPVNTKMKERAYAKKIRELVDAFDRTKETAAVTISREQAHIITKVKRFSMAAESPLQRLEQALHPWVAFLVLPLFALANAGIELPDSVSGVFASPVTMGVMLGLVLGKPIGLLLMSWTFVKFGWGKLGTNVNWGHMVAISVLSGLGFTMAIFISELAFASEVMRMEAKLGILFASVTAGIIGTLLFMRCKPVHSVG